jgi:iturin family lipopeptide synthetase A
MDSRQQRISEFLRRYSARTASSKASRSKYGRYLADSRASAGFRENIKEIQYPILGDRAKGSRLWDADGNEYVDLAMGFGAQLFGHSAPFIVNALSEQLRKGLYLGPQSPLAGEVAKQICALTGVERVCFCNSGTEAVMTALRLARSRTRRDKVAMFKWSYHGHFDGTLARPSGSLHAGRPLTPGISPSFVNDVLLLDYGELSSISYLDSVKNDLAAVIVEPVQGLRPHIQPRRFLQELRRWCCANGVALIFDEVLVGFRIHPGGAQAHFGVEADLVTYGKIIGGGLAIGVVAGKADYMDAIDGGDWHFGDDSRPGRRRTFFAGTFNKNPLCMATAHAVLAKLEELGPTLQRDLSDRTQRVADELNVFFKANHIGMAVVNFGSMFRFVGHGSDLDLFHYHLLERGIFVWEGRSCFLSTAHEEADITFVIEAAKGAALAVRNPLECSESVEEGDVSYEDLSR